MDLSQTEHALRGRDVPLRAPCAGVSLGTWQLSVLDDDPSTLVDMRDVAEQSARPIARDARNRGLQVFVAHNAMIAYVFQDKSDAEAVAFLQYYQGDEDYPYVLHEVRTKR